MEAQRKAVSRFINGRGQGHGCLIWLSDGLFRIANTQGVQGVCGFGMCLDFLRRQINVRLLRYSTMTIGCVCISYRHGATTGDCFKPLLQAAVWRF